MDEYTKMVLALPDEFFEGWEWKHGDQFIVSYCDEPDVYYIGDCGLVEGKPHDIVSEDYFEIKGEIRPLPSQKQLQDMIKKHIARHNLKLNDLDLLQRVIEWHTRRDPEHKQDKCAEILFLDVLLWMNLKTWNGRIWI